MDQTGELLAGFVTILGLIILFLMVYHWKKYVFTGKLQKDYKIVLKPEHMKHCFKCGQVATRFVTDLQEVKTLDSSDIQVNETINGVTRQHYYKNVGNRYLCRVCTDQCNITRLPTNG